MKKIRLSCNLHQLVCLKGKFKDLVGNLKVFFHCALNSKKIFFVIRRFYSLQDDLEDLVLCWLISSSHKYNVYVCAYLYVDYKLHTQVVYEHPNTLMVFEFFYVLEVYI
jgi:hypothetical protein